MGKDKKKGKAADVEKAQVKAAELATDAGKGGGKEAGSAPPAATTTANTASPKNGKAAGKIFKLF